MSRRRSDTRTNGNRLSLTEVPPARRIPTLVEDVEAGLLVPPRSMPPKYFYDGVGSHLFDQICDAPEYYPTRTEAGLLERHAAEIMAVVRPGEILELGAGTMRKTRHLLDAGEMSDLHSYAPFDISADALRETGRRILAEYDWLAVNLLVGDYHAGLVNLPGSDDRRLVVFLGGTIGNFDADDAYAFLRELGRHMAAGDRLLIGMDRVKDRNVLEAAYNDAEGVTAAFNLNLLAVLNREAGTDFDPARFRHEAVYNAGERRIEMYLVSLAEQAVNIGALGRTIVIGEGERILTEISRKFSDETIRDLLESAGFRIERHFLPENGYFSLVLAHTA